MEGGLKGGRGGTILVHARGIMVNTPYLKNSARNSREGYKYFFKLGKSLQSNISAKHSLENQTALPAH